MHFSLVGSSSSKVSTIAVRGRMGRHGVATRAVASVVTKIELEASLLLPPYLSRFRRETEVHRTFRYRRDGTIAASIEQKGQPIPAPQSSLLPPHQQPLVFLPKRLAKREPVASSATASSSCFFGDRGVVAASHKLRTETSEKLTGSAAFPVYCNAARFGDQQDGRVPVTPSDDPGL
jgi:hypothetical protein